ncbi:MAG: helix-turn-helix domain-containing protein, partial [Pseudonocardiaceae bacterium]
MTHREPTVRSRELGAGLRQAMQDAGLNGKQAARLLDVTPGYVSLLLSGKRGASELDLDSQTACLFLEEPEEIAAYQHILKV